MQLQVGIAVTLMMWLALVLAVVATAIRWIRRTHPGYRRWGIAGLLLVLSLFLLILPASAPAWISTVSADAGFAIASILYLEGAREFRGLAPRSGLAYVGGAVAIGAVAFYRYVVPNMNARAVVMSTFLGIILALVSIRLLRAVPPAHKFGQTFTGGMFALCAATLLLRAFYCYFGPAMTGRSAVSGLYGVLFLAIVAEMAAFSTGITLMADERVISNLKDVGERASLAHAELARRIEVETALRESEERFRLAQRVAAVGTFDWNIETGVNTWTPELEAMYGLPPGGFRRTQKAWEDLIHPNDRAEAVQRVEESLKTGRPVEQEWRVIWPDGSVHWIAGRWQVSKNAAGDPLHLTGVNIDITERKNMEEALRKSEERFRLATRATNDAIWDIDLKTGTVSRNETYSELYGRPPETSDSWQWWIDNIHPEDRARTVDAFQAALNGGASSWSGEYRFLRADGKWAYIYDRGYIARDASGSAWRVIGAMQDLTEQKQVEAAMRESEERFRRVFEEGPLGLALVGKDYRFLKVNSALCQIVGYSEAELVRMSFVDITHPDDVRADVGLAERLFRGEIPYYRIQKRYVKKNGEIIWINLTGAIIRSQEGETLYGLAMIEDITEAKRTQEESVAKQKLESLGTLAAGIAHDFNNVLGGVVAQAELAMEGSSYPLRELKTIREVAMRASEIVRQLMIYAGKESPVIEPVDVSRTIRDMVGLLKVSVSKHADLKMELSQDLPAVQSNAAQLRQIVLNLVTNASEAIGDRGGLIRVTTNCVKVDRHSSGAISDHLAEESYVQLEVSDTGHGMSPETQARVFDPFFTTKSAGHGLGLAVVQGIVRGLGGRIQLTSELGKGTTFQILIPCADNTASASSEAISGIDESPRPSRDATVLVVEDEDPLRQAVAKMLCKAGFEVFEAADGSCAIDLLHSNGEKIDVVFLDLTIPGASSREVVAEAVRARPDIRVVLTSAYSEEMIPGTLGAPQVCGFVRKPFQIVDLVKTLRNACPLR